MTVAIHYSSVQLAADGKEVFGLQIAVTHFLRAYFRYSKQEKFHFLVGAQQDWDEILRVAGSVGLDEARLAGLDRRYPRENFGKFDVIFRPDPHTVKLFWQRQMLPAPGFSLCTIAHAISGVETGEVLEQYCLAPSDKHDAIICPSHAVKAAIKKFWELYSDYLQQRFGTAFTCPVQLPVLPLGIDVAHYEAKAAASKRQEQRQKLGLGDDDILLLWVGRLSYAIKAHPLTMYQAAERVAERTGKKVLLAMVGYFMPVKSEPHFRDLAKDVCHKAQVEFVANNDPRFPDGLWAAGDVFLSLIDNMQESFGLTPLEAMAAGLPRVISDWDGYRDSVTHGEDGFLVPTMQPPPGQGRVLSELVTTGREYYGGFLGKSAMSVAVDAAKAADYIVTLIEQPDLRRRMAENARARVRRDYDWASVVPRYEALWDQLAEARRATKKVDAPYVSALPQAPDPFTMYESFPTAALRVSDRISLIASVEQIRLLWKHEMNIFALDIMAGPDVAAQIMRFIADGSPRIGDVLRQFPAVESSRMWRTIAWMLKMGIFGVNPSQSFESQI